MLEEFPPTYFNNVHLGKKKIVWMSFEQPNVRTFRNFDVTNKKLREIEFFLLILKIIVSIKSF